MSQFDQLETLAWGSQAARDEIRLLRQEVEELKAIIWMAADSQISGELLIGDRSKAMYRKDDCRIESHEDQANRCTRIKAILR